MFKEFLTYITGADVIHSVAEKNNRVSEKYARSPHSWNKPWDLPDLPLSGMVEMYGNIAIGIVKYPLVLSLRCSVILTKSAQKILHR